MKRDIQIIIVETSAIVYEGLAGVFLKSGEKFHVTVTSTLEELEQIFTRRRVNVIIINPSLIQNNLKTFNQLKKQFDTTQWIGFVYAHYDQQFLSMFDAMITISDTAGNIVSSINKALDSTDSKTEQLADVLSDREIDVLKLLATGLANKEIADKLNISINTVITHRKNISQKTGIKSVSGLTIYAVLKKLITIEHIQE